ncbi:hypothetical protein BDA99DRAFT_484798 [Phascolomyces articulosus]|uniref:ArfGap-domain-containing protein n=1 Tax=Phascolomyces articulosus TaxID=60185 RepID=A0AAD5PBX0_9FUNG|nr:hypothetical protein BDA99DRAFT_484798 [Phascolomyces articulosus]
MLHRPLISTTTGAGTVSNSIACGERDWEDGPAFRSTISQLEAKTSTLKQSVKRVLKTATACLEANQALLRADKQFMNALRETSCTEPLFTHYLDSAWEDMTSERERLQFSMQTLLIDPLQKLYECDIKKAEQKRRQFEEESKKYYASLSKYLGGKKNETKYIAKKSRYDMIRFDYYTFLTDLHRGKKETELLYHLFSLQERQNAYYSNVAQNLEKKKQGLEHVAGLIATASREQAIVNKERLITRKVLQEALDQVSTTSTTYGGATTSTTIKEKRNSFHQNKMTTPSSETKFHGIRDLQSNLNGSDKPAHGVTWHKYWCVLRTGQLCEYSNWKRNPAAHREPLNLRFATVRMARSTDRKFCFEVITPQFRRLYQAMSQTDMDDWISTINNAIESVLNGVGSTTDFNNQDQPQQQQPQQQKRRNSMGGAFVGMTTEAKRKFYRHSVGPVKRASSGFTDFADLLPGSLYLPASFSNKESESSTESSLPSLAASGVPPVPQAKDDSNNNNKASTTTLAKKEGSIPQLLQRLYEADVSNTRCADCGSDNPEWCSLNIGILLCIECSGIHRSLGSHLSKVRSLMLDSASYTPEVINMLLALSNARSNAVWDPRIITSSSSSLTDDHNDTITTKTTIRPTSQSSRKDKVDYISAKYREKTFVRPIKNKNPQTLLLEAIEKDDLPLASHAFALGADPNVPHVASTLTLFTSTDAASSDSNSNNDDGDKLPKYISLPVLDAEGEQMPDKFLQFPVPEPFAVRYPLHFALLKRHDHDGGQGVADFIMAEFLFQNGADAFIIDPYNGYPLSELIGMGYAVDDSALMYFNQKITSRGARRVWRTSVNSTLSASPQCKKT